MGSEVVQGAAVLGSKANRSEARRVQRSARLALLLTTLALLASTAGADIRGRCSRTSTTAAGQAAHSGTPSVSAGRAPGSSSTTTPVPSWSSSSPTSTATTPSCSPPEPTPCAWSTRRSPPHARSVVGLLPVQTFRTDASDSGAAVAVTDHVGGEVPSLVDAGPNTTGLTLAQLTTATTTAQSITTVTFGGGPNASTSTSASTSTRSST